MDGANVTRGKGEKAAKKVYPKQAQETLMY
jgi:hypothetical protein